MWFKQIQLYQLSKSSTFAVESLKETLAELAFTACPPSMPFTYGWVAPVEEDEDRLIRPIHNNLAICLQVEEKILPAAVIKKELLAVVKEVETSESRKLRQKEKLDLKDQLITTLLPRAFSKLTKIYAYIDNTNHWLVLGTANRKLTDIFMSAFKKIGDG